MNVRSLFAVPILVATAAGLSAAPDPSFEQAIATPLVELKRAAPIPAPVKAVQVSHDRRRGRVDRSDRWDRRPGRGDWDRPGWGGSRRESCNASDRGWEEHWGGHGGYGFTPSQACGQCKKPHGPHGECSYRCTVEMTQCKAVFVRQDGTTGTSYEGRRASDRYDAEDSAMSRCRDDNWYNRDGGRCRVDGCQQVDETTDSGRC
ncbi:MAG: hypothetical protein HY553_15480 [Elusimicrobia bacterium]|nr:hypothetical protein [Elusimicrobiota bacterium]